MMGYLTARRAATVFAIGLYMMAILHARAQTTRPGGMSADSPVTFPKQGALPAKYPPDLSGGKNQATEPGDYIFKTPQRSLKQIKLIQSEMPVGSFAAPVLDWTKLSHTRRLLSEGGDLRLLALGDSIVNDMMRSGWVALLADAYPK
jgi:hypothetical protein